MVAFKHSGRAFEAGLCHAHRAVCRLRSPSGVHALGPRTIGQVLNDAARHAACNAKGIDQLFFCQIECSAQTSDAAHHTKNSRGVETGFVNTRGCHCTQTAHHLNTDGHTAQQLFARQSMTLCSSQQSRHDDHARMHRAAFISVVKVFAVRCDAVHKGSAFYAALLRETKHRAIAVLLKRAERCFDIRFVARRNANARHVQDQTLAHLLTQCFFFWMCANDARR